MPEPQTPLSERPWEDVEQMVGVDDARERILAAFCPLPAVSVSILDALDLTLAEDVVADRDIPPFRNSAMDGYAVRAADTRAAAADAPVSLRIVAHLAAGYPANVEVTAGTAARIMTGAPVPKGADAVVRFEETDEPTYGTRSDGDRRAAVRVTRPAKAWDNVREAGEDIRAGAPTLRAGARVRPAEIGVLASLNRATVPVHRRPVVAILSTGDEVIDLGPELQPGQIRNSNSYLLAAMVRRLGAEPRMLGIARDAIDDLTDRLRFAQQADFVVTSGGVSLGDYDMVKDVLRARGEIAIWQVRMKPGKPLAFGWLSGVPLLGLPGNPVAAAVSFEQFGRPAILKMMGYQNLDLPTIEATLTEPVDNRGHRRHYVRAWVERTAEGYSVRPAGDQGAGVLTSLARANGLLVVPEAIESATPGMQLPVQMIDWRVD
ncbi:MAG: molybdopterin molybdotransferase MoeA [Thermomicrobiales bacterium]